MNTYRLVWSPEGKTIATVQARTAKAAKRKAPQPYRRYLGEIYTELIEPIRSYIVVYTASGVGRTQSSRWGLRIDAENYAATITELGRSDVSIVPSALPPEIFPHCKGSLSQAIGGKCFRCGKVLTPADAREGMED